MTATPVPLGSDEDEPSASTRRDVLLSTRALTVGFTQPLLPPIDVEVLRGEFVVVLGRNGAGKTTWFRTVLGLVPPLGGEVQRKPGLRVAYVPQTGAIDAVVPVSAREVVMWGRLRGRSFLRAFATRADRDACDRALEEAGAAALARRPFRELSRGQRQRIFFARMLATEADLALLDEPTAAMDAIAEREAIQRLTSLTSTRNMAVIVVSHSLDLAAERADKILLFDREYQEVHYGDRAAVSNREAFNRQRAGRTEASLGR
jgi:zinc transport system ATP-binding protein